MKAACKYTQIDWNLPSFGMFVVCLHCISKELYPKGGKKTRWDKDVDELAGEGDAEYDEGRAEDAEEEEEPEADAIVEAERPVPLHVPAVPASVSPGADALDEPECPVPLHVLAVPASVSIRADAIVEPGCPVPLQEHVPVVPSSVSHAPDLHKLGPLALRSSSSLAPTELETPDRERPALADRMLPYDEGKLTPTPVSPPPSIIVKEVVLVVDSPKKVVKAEIPEDVSEGVAPVVAETSERVPIKSRAAAMRELAILEAELLNSQLFVRIWLPYGFDCCWVSWLP